MSLWGDTKRWFSRRLNPGANTFIEGGGSDGGGRFDSFNRSAEKLREYEEIYERGGPVAQLVDTRALMSFGTGTEFVSPEDDDYHAVVDGDEVTPTEWLDRAFNDRDNLFVDIGRDSYIYGDALCEIVETRGGDFAGLAPINPKTMEPSWNDHGEIHRWTQQIDKGGNKKRRETFLDDEIAHFKLRSVGRSPLGISLIGQNYDEIQRFAKNQEAIANAVHLHGFPKYHVKVGKEDSGQVVPDTDLRRVRSRFKNFNEKTNWVTGTDIDISSVDTGGFEIDGLANHDLQILAAGFSVPEEMAGLGRGSTEATAKVRLQAFERMARAEQRNLADQFVGEVVRPVLRRYSPFPADIPIDIQFGDVVSDQTATAEWLSAFREYYTVDEVREKLGDNPAPEDEELGPPVDESAQGGGWGGSDADRARDRLDPGAFEAGPETGDASDPTATADGTGIHTMRRASDEDDLSAYLSGDGPFAPPEGVEVADAEDAFNRIFAGAVWSDDTSRELGNFVPSEMPENVRTRLIEAIRDGAIFSTFETVPSSERFALQREFVNALSGDGTGWSIRELQNRLVDLLDGITPSQAETIARTELAAVTNEARRIYYDEEIDDATFRWVGPDDHRTTEACEWLRDQTEDGVTMDRLLELQEQVHNGEVSGIDGFPGLEFRRFVVHPNERHTFVRHYDR